MALFWFSRRVLLALFVVAAEAHAGVEKPGRDRLQDPLPAGAVLRLGTARLRHAGANRVQFIHDGNAILSCGADDAVRLWETKTGRELAHFAGSFAYLSPDERTLVTTSDAVCVWDMATLKETARVPLDREIDAHFGHQCALTANRKSLVLLLRGKKTVVGGSHMTTKVQSWDLNTSKLIGEWANTDTGSYFFLSPDANIVVANNGGEGFKLRDAATGKHLRDWPFTLYSRSIFSPDGQTMVGLMFGETDDVSKGGHLVGRDINTGKDRFRIRTTSNLWAWFFSPDGRKLATGPGQLGSYSPVVPEKRSLLILETATGKTLHELRVHKDGYQNVVFSADGKRLALSERYSAITIWNLDTGKKIRNISCPISQYSSFDLSPDGKTLVAIVGSCIHLWDIESGQCLLQQPAHEKAPIALTFSADAKTLASMDLDAVTRIWNTKTGQQIDWLKPLPAGDQQHFYPFEAPMLTLGRNAQVHALGMSRARWGSSDGRSSHSMVHQVDLVTRKHVRSFGSDQTPIGSFALSHDGKTLAAAMGRHIHLWDTATGMERAVFAWREEIPQAHIDVHGLPNPPVLAFSPDGKILATRSYRHAAEDLRIASITLWEVATLKARHRIEGGVPPTGWAGGGRMGQAFPVFDTNGGSLALSPDGRTLALGHGDTLRLWDIARNKEIRRFGGQVHCEFTAFSPDAKLLAANGQDGSVFLWDVATGTALRPIKTAGKFTCFRFSPDCRTIATGGEDTSVLLWDLAKVVASAEAASADGAFDALWNDLASENASTAGKAILALSQGGSESLTQLKKRLRPIVPADPKRLTQLLAELESGQFPIREKARCELEKLGDLALPILRQSSENKLSLEAQRRVEALLEKLAGPAQDQETLRILRAIETLEQIGSPESRRILETLAKGSLGHRVTISAQEASVRLQIRQGR
jgi:WD40 repeat protein